MSTPPAAVLWRAPRTPYCRALGSTPLSPAACSREHCSPPDAVLRGAPPDPMLPCSGEHICINPCSRALEGTPCPILAPSLPYWDTVRRTGPAHANVSMCVRLVHRARRVWSALFGQPCSGEHLVTPCCRALETPPHPLQPCSGERPPTPCSRALREHPLIPCSRALELNPLPPFAVL